MKGLKQRENSFDMAPQNKIAVHEHIKRPKRLRDALVVVLYVESWTKMGISKVEKQGFFRSS